MPRSEAFLNGWADASALCQRKNPYPEGSIENLEYDYGYSSSMDDNP